MRFVIALLFLMACRQSGTAPSAVEMQSEQAPVQESWGVHTYVTQTQAGRTESRRRMGFIADYVALYESNRRQYQHLKRIDNPVVIHLFNADGDSSATLTANSVLYFDNENRLEAAGNVVVLAQDGARLATEALRWREADRTIRSDSMVRITTSKEDVQGQGLVADEDLKTYRLGRFTARVMLEE